MDKSGVMKSLVPLRYYTYRGPEGSGSINTNAILLIRKDVVKNAPPNGLKITIEWKDETDDVIGE